MIPGTVFLSLALISTLVAAVLFALGQRSPLTSRLLAAARLTAVAAAVLVACASGYLIYLIATHQFQYIYVAEFSSRSAQARYLLAAFWGGQEGSILLWLFWTSVLGAVLAFKAGGRESRVWPLFAVLQTYLLSLVLIKSPFRITDGIIPADGQGLNPLLENQWMVIHPPILFLGFASLALPWIWAVYGLVYKDWDGSIRRMFPWALFSFAIHGFGVALGGYWAYETLGWGGFWGWDPVENSSLVPWLFLIALLHGIPIQKANGGFKVSNLLLATLPFGFMIYGTFLTRTGILADFSVHSFSSLGNEGFSMLLGGVAVAFLLPIIGVIVRFKQIPKPEAYSSVLSREFGYVLAVVALGMIGLITAVGMSAPLITKLWLAKGAGAQASFYNQAAFPLVILMFLAMAATPLLAWKTTEFSKLGARLFPAYAAAIVATVTMFALGGRKPWMLLLLAASVFAIAANLGALVTRMRVPKSRMSAGGVVAHIGAAMLLAGVACLVTFSQQALHLTMVKDQPIEALGYKLTYLGLTSQPYDRSNAIRVKVEKDGRSWEATPHLFMASWQGQEQLFANPPDVHNFLWGDLYLAHFRGPVSMDPQCPNNGVTLHQGDSFSYGGYKFDYRGMAWEKKVREAMMAGGPDAMQKLPEMRIHANLDVSYQGKAYTIQPEYVFNQLTGGKQAVPAALPGPPNAIVSISSVELPSTVTLSTTNLPDALEMVQLDLSTKPMVWLVWMGTLLYTLGGFAAYRRRATEFAQEQATIVEPNLDAPKKPVVAKQRKRVRQVLPGT
ncbi:MAG TPA: cytochrome c biogenesis protein CcsA [Capsulimonadaceae bacterium]|jgi:cytochrome c-type biogenesis protein CcmF